MLKIQMGRVIWGPAVKIVTTTSSKERAKARRPPATRAVAMFGHIT